MAEKKTYYKYAKKGENKPKAEYKPKRGPNDGSGFTVKGSWSNFGSRFTVHGSRLLVVKD